MQDNVLEQGLSSENVHNKLSGENLSYLKSAASWTKFLAIIAFIVTAFVVLAGLFFTIFLSSMVGALDTPGTRGLSMFGPGLGLFYLALAIPAFFGGLYLNRFSNRMNSVWRTNSPDDLTAAFKNLRNYFRLNGWMIIGFFILYIVMMVAISAGAMSGLMNNKY